MVVISVGVGGFCVRVVISVGVGGFCVRVVISVGVGGFCQGSNQCRWVLSG